MGCAGVDRARIAIVECFFIIAIDFNERKGTNTGDVTAYTSDMNFVLDFREE